ncbi:hypothetical protein NPIL_678981 [Nephila pilipes]|uniref:Uncharacterized protein n=1 Tax=Nephila pilipes TaxID=299642 RepID=A0A8X6UHC3_NEPPI|nr:hypothetical protein NPIL_678981 [Nephila pilipes]
MCKFDYYYFVWTSDIGSSLLPKHAVPECPVHTAGNFDSSRLPRVWNTPKSIASVCVCFDKQDAVVVSLTRPGPLPRRSF